MRTASCRQGAQASNAQDEDSSSATLLIFSAKRDRARMNFSALLIFLPFPKAISRHSIIDLVKR